MQNTLIVDFQYIAENDQVVARKEKEISFIGHNELEAYMAGCSRVEEQYPGKPSLGANGYPGSMQDAFNLAVEHGYGFNKITILN